MTPARGKTGLERLSCLLGPRDRDFLIHPRSSQGPRELDATSAEPHGASEITPRIRAALPLVDAVEAPTLLEDKTVGEESARALVILGLAP